MKLFIFFAMNSVDTDAAQTVNYNLMANPTLPVLPKLDSLKIMLLNAENLFLLSDEPLTEAQLSLTETQWQRLSTSVFDNKPLHKLRRLAELILSETPDILMLAEVGGLESLNQFNRLFLQDRYSPALVEGNSDRSIDVGYLVRKNQSFYFDLFSNKNHLLQFVYPHEIDKNSPSRKFSRDVAELHLFRQQNSRPFLVFLLTHLKSRLDPDNVDPNGFLRRQAELKSLIEIQKKVQSRVGSHVPMVIAGDFNGNAAKLGTDPEFQPIYDQTDWLDVCEIAKLPTDKRATYFQVSRQNRSEGRQIDFAFLTTHSQDLLDPKSVSVWRYRDDQGIELDPPTTLDAKGALPSDHYPLVFRLLQIPLVD